MELIDMPGGRPTTYNKEIAQEICEKVSSRGAGLQTFCNENPHWPHLDTIYLWLKKHKEFSEAYAKAKRDQVTALVDEIIQISDDSARDVIVKEDRDGNEYEVCNTEFVNRSRLRVDTRKWIAAKLVPRLYGDNALARELADEMEEFRKMLGERNGNINRSETKENTEE